MVIFFYDKTFEGLLTAVFDAYNRKTFPQRLMKTGETPPLFTDEVYTVWTQKTSAERVWKALERKLKKEACNMLNLREATSCCSAISAKHSIRSTTSP